MGVPFALTAASVLLMIFLYTLQGGVKTIVWTDTLQTLFMLGALVGTILYIILDPQMSDWPQRMQASGMSTIFNWDVKDRLYFWKQLISGIFVAIVMTGLDQEIDAEELSVRTSRTLKRTFASVQPRVGIYQPVVLVLGRAVVLEGRTDGYRALPEKADDLFPTLALQHFPPWLGLIFIIGLISALFPSADGALTALTSSTCIDLIGIRERGWSDEAHATFASACACRYPRVLFFALVLWFYYRQDDSIITLLYGLAAITYGPLLGFVCFWHSHQTATGRCPGPLGLYRGRCVSYLLRMVSKDLFYGSSSVLKRC